MKVIRTRLLLFLCLLTAGGALAAQQTAGLDVQADNLQFEQEDNTVTATGNVVLRKGPQSLKADVITYNTKTEEAFARGNVVLTTEDRVFRGDELRYNFLTQEGDFPDLEVKSGPFTVNAARVQQLGPVQTRLSDVVITTCPDTENPEFAITAGKVDAYEQEVYVMRNALFRLHGIPFFWVPRLVVDQKRQPTNLDVMPGYSSRDGAALLTTYNRYPSEGYETRTHLDYRTERGIAAGQDWIWYDADQNAWRGALEVYGALDDAPYKNDEQEAQLREQGIDLEEERYRLKFGHRQTLTPRDSLWLKAEYLSDARVVNDFFEDEFRDAPTPETRATYNASGDNWNAAIDGVMQLNSDEFASVNRLPEATFNIPLTPLLDTGFQIESESAAGLLERTFTELQRENGSTEYDSLRFHTANTVYYPTKQFGWLNVIPRAGITATYYGTTREVEETVTPVSSVDEDGIISTDFETQTEVVDGDADIRLLPEIGLESSFKAFGIVHDDPTTMGTGLRHVVEPFIDYSFIPEPGLEPDEIYQFDAIDALGERHEVALGVRNKWQTRQRRTGSGTYIHDLVNLDIRTLYDLRSEADPSLGTVRFDLEWHPARWMQARIKTDYDADEGSVRNVISEVAFVAPESRNELRIDQFYREDANHTLQFRYKLNPRGRVGLRGYTRLELEEDGLEEQGLTLVFRNDCVGYGIGGRWQLGETYSDGTEDEDEWDVYLQFWLNAFPKAIIGTDDNDF
jgi:lipopolysaccharide assembly outer membrane protein LptD (OstA)